MRMRIYASSSFLTGRFQAVLFDSRTSEATTTPMIETDSVLRDLSFSFSGAWCSGSLERGHSQIEPSDAVTYSLSVLS